MIIFGVACLKPNDELLKTLKSLEKCKVQWKAILKIKFVDMDFMEYLKDGRYDVNFSEDNGIYDAFNFIANRAIQIGGHLIYLGAGDILASDLTFIDDISASEERIIQCRSLIINKISNEKRMNFDGILCKSYYSGHPYAPCHQACIIHTKIYEKVGVFSTDFHIAGDADHFIRASLMNIPVARCEKIISEMSTHGISSDPRYFRKQIIDNIKLYKKYRKFFGFGYFAHLVLFVIRRYLNGSLIFLRR